LLKVEINRTLPGFKLDIAFSVNGEVLGILGPSGSGKTMTLLCIAGLLHPDSGFIQLNDRVLFDSTKKLEPAAQRQKCRVCVPELCLIPPSFCR
jgi:molybdate transport system ATP-binding protein